jgi:hypothetical protein
VPFGAAHRQRSGRVRCAHSGAPGVGCGTPTSFRKFPATGIANRLSGRPVNVPLLGEIVASTWANRPRRRRGQV